MNNIIKICQRLRGLPFEDVRKVFTILARERYGYLHSVRTDLVLSGYERVEADAGSIVTSDGREVIWVAGAAWALTLANHTTQLEAAFAQIKNQEEAAKSVVGTESMSIMTCPKCGDSLQHSAVCPKCAAGKLGYRHRYTCVCGAVDMVSKDAL